jgi:hypothetical protein
MIPLRSPVSAWRVGKRGRRSTVSRRRQAKGRGGRRRSDHHRPGCETDEPPHGRTVDCDGLGKTRFRGQVPPCAQRWRSPDRRISCRLGGRSRAVTRDCAQRGIRPSAQPETVCSLAPDGAFPHRPRRRRSTLARHIQLVGEGIAVTRAWSSKRPERRAPAHRKARRLARSASAGPRHVIGPIGSRAKPRPSRSALTGPTCGPVERWLARGPGTPVDTRPGRTREGG